MATIDDLAAAFWDRSGPAPAFPRDLEGPVLWGLPLALVKMPRLRAAAVDAWFRERGQDHAIAGQDRELRACLFALSGRGVVFLDGADPADEQRFSLAHEVAHFVADYLVPREAILAKLGQGYADILDGRRRPESAERIDGLLAGMTIGVHRHLMSRGPEATARVGHAESRADRLAFELLAPRAAVKRAARRLGPDPVGLTALLNRRFGLPIALASTYASTFMPSPEPVRVRDWIRRDVEVPPSRRNKNRETV